MAPVLFHVLQLSDFPEGPDWWGIDEQKRVLESIAQMKGNRIGFHTYPYSSNQVRTFLAMYESRSRREECMKADAGNRSRR
jgi:hypothetical protein